MDLLERIHTNAKPGVEQEVLCLEAMIEAVRCHLLCGGWPYHEYQLQPEPSCVDIARIFIRPEELYQFAGYIRPNVSIRLIAQWIEEGQQCLVQRRVLLSNTLTHQLAIADNTTDVNCYVIAFNQEWLEQLAAA